MSVPVQSPTIAELLATYRSGERDPLTVVTDLLERIRLVDHRVNATVTVMSERSLRLAEESVSRWRRGDARPLEGVPFGVKDTIDIAGFTATGGSRVYKDRLATRTATVVERLEAAGAIPMTKDGTTEFAVGGPHNPAFGVVRNPWGLDRWSGGSSAGSAAGVAAGYFPFAIGSDGGGSIRIPAAWCGVTGLKTTTGSVPKGGVMPTSWTMGCLGPIARTAHDAEIVFRHIAGSDGSDPRSPDGPPKLPGAAAGVRGLRLGVPEKWLEAQACDSTVRHLFDGALQALRDQGATLVPVDIPLAPLAHDIGYQVLFTEAASLHEINRDRYDEYDPVTVRRIAQGVVTSARDYILAMRFRHDLQREFDAAFSVADAIMTPTTPATACELDGLTVGIDGQRVPLYEAQATSTAMVNLAGLPAIAIPTGFAGDGLPTSLQAIAGPHQEHVCLGIGQALQAVSDHHLRAPSMDL